MLNLKKRAALLMLLGLLLQGCGAKPAVLRPGSLPVLPELPPSARQESAPPECSPTCSERWRQRVLQWQQRLIEQGLPVEPASEPMME